MCLCRKEALWCVLQLRWVIHLHTNDRVWTNHDTLAALNTDVWVPCGNLSGNIAFLPTGGPRWIRSIRRKCAYRHGITIARNHGPEHVAHKIGCFSGNWWSACEHWQENSLP